MFQPAAVNRNEMYVPLISVLTGAVQWLPQVCEEWQTRLLQREWPHPGPRWENVWQHLLHVWGLLVSRTAAGKYGRVLSFLLHFLIYFFALFYSILFLKIVCVSCQWHYWATFLHNVIIIKEQSLYLNLWLVEFLREWKKMQNKDLTCAEWDMRSSEFTPQIPKQTNQYAK